MKNNQKAMIIKRFIYVTFALALAVSCSTPKRILYFQDAAIVNGMRTIPHKLITVRPKDKISIIVNTSSEKLTALFNLPYVTQRLGQNVTSAIGGTTAYSQGYISGYTVDEKGCIDFPVLGRIRVEGMTRDQIAQTIKDELNRQGQASDAVVTVEFMNLYYQVLGEVTKPGRYPIDKDEITVLDALSVAGDLTIYGKRNNVTVFRNQDGVQECHTMDLCSMESLINSPAYYLQQGDVIYVEPNGVRARHSTVNGNNVRSTSFWISLASLASSISLVIINSLSK